MTEKKWYRFFYAIVWPFVMLFYPMKFIGRENIPEGGALVCANHSAAVDPFFLAFALGRKKRICAMAKESLLNIFFQFLLLFFRHFITANHFLLKFFHCFWCFQRFPENPCGLIQLHSSLLVCYFLPIRQKIMCVPDFLQ